MGKSKTAKTTKLNYRMGKSKTAKTTKLGKTYKGWVWPTGQTQPLSVQNTYMNTPLDVNLT
jgi:hypothetical protein